MPKNRQNGKVYNAKMLTFRKSVILYFFVSGKVQLAASASVHGANGKGLRYVTRWTTTLVLREYRSPCELGRVHDEVALDKRLR